MVPGKGRGRRTRYAGVQPMSAGAGPDIPNTAILNIALSAEDELVCPVGLVHVKLQRLRELRSGQIEIQVIFKVGDSVVAPQLLPPESVRIWSGAADAEFCRAASEGWRTLVLRH